MTENAQPRLSFSERKAERESKLKTLAEHFYGQAQAKMMPTMQFRWFVPERKWPTYAQPVLQQKFIESTADGGVEHWLTIPTVTDEANG